MGRATLVGGLLGALCLGLWWSWGGDDSAPPQPVVEADSSTQEQPVVRATPEDTSVSLEPKVESVSEPSARVEVGTQSRFPMGLVLDESGAPVEGALVTLTAWLEDFDWIRSQWMPIPDVDTAGATVEAQTGPDGRFRFTRLPEAGEGRPLVLWVTHPGHRAEGRVLAPGEGLGKGAEHQSFQLKAAPGFACRVTNLGQPAVAAEVHLRFAVTPENLYPRVAELPNAEWVFLRTVETDTLGIARYGDIEALAQVVAYSGELESAPWRGPSRGQVELELLPTFTVEGVTEIRGGLDEAWGSAHVEIGAMTGVDRIALHQCRVRDDGTFGPDRVPLAASMLGVASLVGGSLTPNQADFDLPGAGGRVFLELSAEAGTIVWFAAYDTADQLITTATARAFWFDGGRVETREYPAQPSGMIAVPVIREGLVGGMLSAPGYADFELTPFRVPEADVQEHWVTLDRARVLRGRCMAGDKPVTDFVVHVWASRSPLLTRKLVVTGSEDGSFETDRAPTGDLSMLAFAPDVGVSNVTYLVRGATTEPVLELTPGLQAHGRLVDSIGAPIWGARIVPVLPEQKLATKRIAPGVESDTDGRFEVGGLPTGGGKLLVSAPGYVRRTLTVAPAPELDVDLGDVRIEHAQTLHVRAQLPPGSPAYVFFVEGSDAFPPMDMPASGVLDIEGVAPGRYDFTLQDVETRLSIMARRTLQEGAAWELNLDLVSGTGLRVSYIGEEPEGNLSLAVYRTDAAGELAGIWAAFNPRQGRELIVPRVLAAGDVLVTMEDIVDGRKSVKHLDIDPSLEFMPVEFDLGDARANVRIVGPEGAAIESLQLQIFEPGLGFPLGWAGTDAEGGAVIPGIDPGSYFVFGRGPSGGQAAWPLEVPLSSEEPVVLEYDPVHELTLHLTEEGLAVPGLHGKLSFAFDEFSFGTTEDSAGDGTMSFEHLQAGAYSVEVTGDDVMPLVVAATLPSKGLDLEVYSRTSFTLRAISVDGVPLAGLKLALFHEALGIDLSLGIEEGWVSSSMGAMVTDATGRLDLEGVPRGVYSWTAGAASGSFEVVRDGSSQVQIVVE